MAAATNITNLDIGKYLKIYSTNGVYNNLPDNSDMWEYIKKLKVAKPEGRQVNYNLRTAYGMAAAQFLDVGTVGAYPGASRSQLLEATAYFKDFGVTIDVPRTLLNKSGSELARYGEPLAEELDAKGTAIARMLSASLFADGTTVVGIVGAAPSVSTADDTITITLSTSDANQGRSHIGWIEEGDRLVFAASDGTVQSTINNTATTVSYWQVQSVDEINDTCVLKPYDSSDAVINITTATLGASDPANGDLMYRNSGIRGDLSGSISDYSTISAGWPGLESLGADDGRVVHGITMSGATSGSVYDAGGAAIDAQHFQVALSTGKRRVGKSKYKYDKAFMFDTAYDAMIESRETDRRFHSVEDGARGTPQLAYRHGKSNVVFETDEFCPKKRIWMVPKEILHFRGTDMDFVEPNPGQKFHLKPNSSGHDRSVRAYMEGTGLLFCVHPAGLISIQNFIV